ncbi:MAG: low molecular weight phosphotyrosine protein phosphatase [Rhodobacteraceae bacterium]|nr:low molecular weight phosphotyrosine protein phosphatase [Paracoccaceae bacterium]
MTRSVLFVCLGNICRSPTAEAVFRGLADGRGLHIDSAGTSGWHDGGRSDPRASAEALRRGYDMSMIRSRQVCEADFDRFDLIIAMDSQNLADLQAVRPKDSDARLELFLDYAPEFRVGDVPDPYFEDNFETVFDMIETASKGLLDRL